MNESVSEVVIRDDENEVVARETQKLDIDSPSSSGSKLGQFCVYYQSPQKEKLTGKRAFSRKVSRPIELESKVVGLMLNQLSNECQSQPMQHVK